MLSRDLARYIDQKRSLGFKFRSQSVQLRSFVAFAEGRGDRYVRCGTYPRGPRRKGPGDRRLPQGP